MNARQQKRFEERFGKRTNLLPTSQYREGLELGYETACQDEGEITKRLGQALEELVALVRGESPGLLNEDSGGCGYLSIEIDAALKAWKGEQ